MSARPASSARSTQSKRELAAEVASVLAFSAIRNRDKVGLLLFTDEVEHYVPPKKGRVHVLRVIRDILFTTPRRRGTDVAAALDFCNDVLRRRAVVFVVSDFIEPPDAFDRLKRLLRTTNKRHDLVLLHLRDRHEEELPALGLLTLEDPETGEVMEIDTGSRSVRETLRPTRPRADGPVPPRGAPGGRRYAGAAHRRALRPRALFLFQEPHQPEVGMKRLLLSFTFARWPRPRSLHAQGTDNHHGPVVYPANTSPDTTMAPDTNAIPAPDSTQAKPSPATPRRRLPRAIP